MTGAADSWSMPRMNAVWPSRLISAPMRCSSRTCWKRFSKIVSVIVPVPSATALSAQNCACMSVGNAGYGAVRTSTALGPPAAHVELDAVAVGMDVGTGFGQLDEDGLERIGGGLDRP